MMAKAAQFSLTLFGGFQLTDNQGNSIDPGPRKVKAMIAWLAVHADIAYPREKIAAIFWPDSEEEGARHSLRQALGSLRKVIADEISPVRTSKNSVWFDSSRAEVDVRRFDEALAGGEIQAAEIISNLYQGDLLVGCNPRSDLFEEWLQDQRNHYRERATNAMCQRLTNLLDRRQFEAAIPVGTRLVNIDPLRESAYRGLMMSHMGLGNHALALRWYRRCERQLMTELDVMPCLETRALHAQLLSTWNRGESETGRQQDRIAQKKRALKQITRGHQRTLYQAESAIEAIVDRVGGQSLLLRSETGELAREVVDQVIALAEPQGFQVCRGEISANGEQARLQTGLVLSDRISSCLVSKASEGLRSDDALETRIGACVGTIRAAAEVSPLLLIVENIHRACAHSLDLLGRVISAAGDTSVLLLMTSTYDGQTTDQAWQGAMVNAPLTTIDIA